MHRKPAGLSPLGLGCAVVRGHDSPRGGGREAQMIRLGVHRQCGRAATALRATYPASTRRKATNLQEVGIPRIPPWAEGPLSPTPQIQGTMSGLGSGQRSSSDSSMVGRLVPAAAGAGNQQQHP